MKIRKTREHLPLFILGIVMVGLFFGVVSKEQQIFASSNASHQAANSTSDYFVTIFDNGNKKTTLRSVSATVRDILARANISYDEADTVEPALDETVNSDNFNINIYRARSVVVIDGQTKISVKTAATDPSAIATAAGVTLLDKDRVDVVTYHGVLESGMLAAYRVVRAKTVNFIFSGKQLSVRTQAGTVSDFLEEQNIDYDPAKIWISLPADSKIADGATFSLYYQGKQTINVDEEIPFTEKITYDYSLDYDKSEITKAGVVGKKTTTYEVEMQDGRELSRTVLSELVTSAPVEQQKRVGRKIVLPPGDHTDWMASAGISPSDYGYVDYIISHESGWRPHAVSPNGYYGLYQTSKSRLENACPNWQSDPVCQLRSATSYATGRYGSWSNAYAFWNKNHWW